MANKTTLQVQVESSQAFAEKISELAGPSDELFVGDRKEIKHGLGSKLDTLGWVSFGISLYSLFSEPLIPLLLKTLRDTGDQTIRISTVLGSLTLTVDREITAEELLKKLQAILPLKTDAGADPL